MTASPSVAAGTSILSERCALSFRLRYECVDIWKVSLSCSEANLAHAEEILSPDEKQRAARIGSQPAHTTFIVARAALRALLGLYLDRMPHTIGFTYAAGGKPAVYDDAGICFSATRSGDMAAFALCLQSPVGIDVERFRVIPNMDRVVERMFSPAEREQLHLLPPDQQQRAFFACWTRKEAYAKATGEGILTRFDNFCVDANPDEPNPKIHFGETTGSEDWVLHNLRLNDECAAALAYRGAERTLAIFDAGSVNQLFSFCRQN